MLSEENKEISRKYYKEVWGNKNLDKIADFISDDFVIHLGGNDYRGFAFYKQLLMSYQKAFPDLKFTLDDLIAENDKVVELWSATGTHLGEFQGIKPTKKYAKISGVDIVSIHNGKITERWAYSDFQGLMKQLGILP